VSDDRFLTEQADKMTHGTFKVTRIQSEHLGRAEADKGWTPAGQQSWETWDDYRRRRDSAEQNKR
jgi:hypothetical protein